MIDNSCDHVRVRIRIRVRVHVSSFVDKPQYPPIGPVLASTSKIDRNDRLSCPSMAPLNPSIFLLFGRMNVRVRVHVHDNDTVPSTIQYTTRISLNEESYTVQYAKHQNILYIVPNIPYIVQNNIQYIVQNIPYIVQDTIQISLYGKPCTVLQYSKSQNGVTDVDFDTHYGVSNKSSHDSSNNVRDIDSDATNNTDTNADADDTVNSVITTTDNV